MNINLNLIWFWLSQFYFGKQFCTQHDGSFMIRLDTKKTQDGLISFISLYLKFESSFLLHVNNVRTENKVTLRL